MEVIHVVRQFSPSVGGLEDAVHNLCRHLSLMPGVTARVVTLDRVFARPDVVLPASETIDGIAVTRIPYRGSRRYPVAPSVLRALADADIVHVHAIDFFFDFMALTRPLHRKVLVASTHGGFFHTAFASRLKKIFFQTVTRASARAYNAICASSENDAANFRRIAGDRVVTIENGVDVDKWRDCAARTPQRSMVFVGRWSGNKRVPALIELTAALQRIAPGWTLHLVGLPGDETVQSLQQTARDHGVEDAVHIHLSPPQAEIGAVMGKCSYIASASAYEGFGISVVEGLSAGLLPLVSAIPPFDKIRNDLGLGASIDPDDPIGTAARIERFHEETAADYRPRQERAMKFSDRYAWKDVASAFKAVYDKALAP